MKTLIATLLVSLASTVSAATLHEIQCSGMSDVVYYADFENKDRKTIKSTRKDFKFAIRKEGYSRYEILNPGYLESMDWQETYSNHNDDVRWYFRDGSRPDIRRITEGKEFVYGINDWDEELIGSDDLHQVFTGCRWTTL